jgi:thioredoxin 1
MAAVAEVNDSTFDQEVLSSERPVLVDFWAPGCPPCAALSPVLEKIAGDMSEQAKFVKVNVTQAPSTAAKYGIRAVPTLYIFKGGEAVDNMIGFQPEQEIRRRVSAVAGQ